MHKHPISPELFAQLLSPDFQERFWARTNKASEDKCWPWNGCTSSGYGKLCVRVGGRQYCLRAHIVSWIIHNQSDFTVGLNILHSCIAAPSCCNPNHLRPDTQRQNLKEMADQGRQVILKGEDKAAHKLTENIVRKVREQYATGNFTQTELARRVGVASAVMCNILNRKAWTHI